MTISTITTTMITTTKITNKDRMEFISAERDKRGTPLRQYYKEKKLNTRSTHKSLNHITSWNEALLDFRIMLVKAIDQSDCSIIQIWTSFVLLYLFEIIMPDELKVKIIAWRYLKWRTSYPRACLGMSKMAQKGTLKVDFRVVAYFF